MFFRKNSGLPPPLIIDFGPLESRPSWAPWALLMVGLVFLADVTHTWWQLRTEFSELLIRVQRVSAPTAERRASSAPPDASRATQSYREIEAILFKDWNPLFKIIADPRFSDVSLLSLEAIGNPGTVRLTIETESLDLVYAYLGYLSDLKVLGEVQINSHRTVNAPGERERLESLITAKWPSATTVPEGGKP